MKTSVAHSDWTGDLFSILKTSGFANNSQQERQRDDYYATEPKAAELLLKLDDFHDIWECACGQGHLAKVFESHRLLSKASDIIDRGYGACMDYLAFSGNWDGDIVTNPPYKYANAFIEKSMRDVLTEGCKLALFLPIRYSEGKSRKVIFEKYPPYKIWVSSSRLICALNGMFDKYDTSAVSYAWFIWHKGYAGESKIGWFN